MPVSNAHTRFLEDNYDLIQRWVHCNDVHLAMYRDWDPTIDPSGIPIGFERFVELDTVSARSSID